MADHSGQPVGNEIKDDPTEALAEYLYDLTLCDPLWNKLSEKLKESWRNEAAQIVANVRRWVVKETNSNG